MSLLISPHPNDFGFFSEAVIVGHPVIILRLDETNGLALGGLTQKPLICRAG